MVGLSFVGSASNTTFAALCNRMSEESLVEFFCCIGLAVGDVNVAGFGVSAQRRIVQYCLRMAAISSN